MENNDTIKELFKEKLGDFEVNVRPEIWSSISSQIASSPAAVGVFASSILTKSIVVFSLVAALSAIVYFSSDKTEPTGKSLKETNSKGLTATETIKEQTQKVENTAIESIVNTQKEQSSKAEVVASEVDIENSLFIENVYNRNGAIENVQAVPVSETPLENSLVLNDKLEINTGVKPFITEVLANLSEGNNQTYNLDLPNVFTPNNDGINDVLILNTEGLTEFSLVVLDQRNKIIYSSQDTNVSWGGLDLSGEPVSSGNYVYFITARDSAGSLVTQHSLLRIER